MNIVCVICSDRLTPSDDVFVTSCGHIFHFACLSQWLERSRTCPQCREKTTQNRIQRVYFNFCNNDTIVEDATTLVATVDSLKFQLMVKEREVKQALEKHDTSKKEAAGLRAEVRALENELTHKDTAILALKEQTRMFKGLSTEAEDAKKEVVRLKKKLDEYRSVQMLINAPSEEVDEMIANTTDPARLLTYIKVMKRELTTSVARRKELRASLRKIQQDLTKVSMERNFLSEEHEKRQQLEELLAVSEMEKEAAESRLREFERKVASCGNNPTPDEAPGQNRVGDNVDRGDDNNTEENNRPIIKDSSIIDLCEDSPLERKKHCKKNRFDKSPSRGSSSGNDENLPLAGYKYNAGREITKRKHKLISHSSGVYSYLAKKPRLPQIDLDDRPSTNMTFDGFGGHSKNDVFPSAGKFSKEWKKPSRLGKKQPKLDDGNNRKLSDFVNLDP